MEGVKGRARRKGKIDGNEGVKGREGRKGRKGRKKGSDEKINNIKLGTS